MVSRKQRRDPFADYIEWTNNRYNPGHYLGGNLPPDLRKSVLGPKARRLSGMMLGISAILGIVSLLAFGPLLREVSLLQTVLSITVVLLLAAAASSMYRSGRTPRQKTRRQSEGRPPHTQK